MSIFRSQLDTRKELDERMFDDSFRVLAEAVTGKGVAGDALEQDYESAQDAIFRIFRFLHLPADKAPDDIESMNERLEYMLRPTGTMRRRVELTANWWRDSVGPLLAVKKDGTVIALLPGLRGYRYYDRAMGKDVKVTAKNADSIELDAFCFYTPFPQRSLGITDLLFFIVRALDKADYARLVIFSLIVTLVGMVTPFATQNLFDSVIPSGQVMAVMPVAVFLISALVAQSLLSMTNTIVVTGMESKLNLSVKSAVMARLLNLPARFFKGYSAGELASRMESTTELCSSLRDAILSTGLSAVFSLVYVVQMGAFAPQLLAPAMIILFANMAFSVLSSWMQVSYQRNLLKSSAKVRAMSFSLISGVQKIKLANAERRMFARWASCYGEKAKLQYRPPIIIRIGPVINVVFTFGSLLVFYAVATLNGVSTAGYMAFYAAYGMVSAALTQLGGVANTIAEIKPMLEMAEPILKTVPEISPNRKPFSRLRGAIELSHVSFHYDADGPSIINDLSLTIKPNQYIAIVGKTGCGKSTLMRILLGFEQPTKGAVYYDGKDLNTLDIRSVRRNIGVVLQNSRLMAGDIYSNIIVSAPWLSLDEATEAAELAGMGEDIKRMPMGMHTLISEGSGGISGGQRQRLMIARAIAPKPKILMFDEATSALDNITQKQVAQSLAKLRCTRIVIAHRLSTIRQCDRILFLDQGRIAEDGTFDELMELNGQFAEMVRRQII